MKRFFVVSLLFFVHTLFAATPYTILISFDGFRWDYANRGLSPNIQQLQQRGISALSLRPAFPSKTFPNHYTIVTGMEPEHHGIIGNDFINSANGKKYKYTDTLSSRESEWYNGEAIWETARKNKIITASYFWPGSEVNDETRRPNYYEKYFHTRPYSERVDGVIKWLQLPIEKRPKLITLYFDATDWQGHRYGPNSEEVNTAIQQLDSTLGYLINNLKEIQMYDSTNIIIVSDHGMSEVSKERVIDIKTMIEEYEVEVEWDGPLMMLEPKDKNNKEKIFKILQTNESHYKAYTKETIPSYYHFSEHPFIYSIILVAETGWSLKNKKSPVFGRGNHGYDKNSLEMHGIFAATGPSFKEGYAAGTIWNIDIYPLLCKILNISPNKNIDGKLERIEYILK